MVSGHFEEASQGHIRLENHEADAVEVFVYYCYLKQVQINIDASCLARLLVLADFLQLPVLKQICIGRLTPLLSEKNIVEIATCLSQLWATNPDLLQAVADHAGCEINMLKAFVIQFQKLQQDSSLQSDGKPKHTVSATAVQTDDQPPPPVTQPLTEETLKYKTAAIAVQTDDNPQPPLTRETQQTYKKTKRGGKKNKKKLQAQQPCGVHDAAGQQGDSAEEEEQDSSLTGGSDEGAAPSAAFLPGASSGDATVEVDRILEMPSSSCPEAESFRLSRGEEQLPQRDNTTIATYDSFN